MLALLPRRFLRDGVDILAKPVTDNCNFSVSLNKFLRNLILEKDKPIFKKCWKQNVSNYRPVSFLPILL